MRDKGERREIVSHNGERSLWAEVLLRAVDDALNGPQALDGSDKLRLIHEARAYLTTPGKDLSILCALAGMDMQAVIDRMKVRIAAAPSPEELASGRKVNRANLTTAATTDRPRRTIQTYSYSSITDTVAGWADAAAHPAGRAVIPQDVEARQARDPAHARRHDPHDHRMVKYHGPVCPGDPQTPQARSDRGTGTRPQRPTPEESTIRNTISTAIALQAVIIGV